MEKTGYTTAQGLEVERLLNAIESVPKEKQPIMAVLAEAFINGSLGYSSSVRNLAATRLSCMRGRSISMPMHLCPPRAIARAHVVSECDMDIGMSGWVSTYGAPSS